MTAIILLLFIGLVIALVLIGIREAIKLGVFLVEVCAMLIVLLAKLLRVASCALFCRPSTH